jgi:hypothetical protein
MFYVVIQVKADTTKYKDQLGARRLGKASLGLSIAGIIVTCIIIAIAVGVSVSRGNIGPTAPPCPNAKYGVKSTCSYKSRRYVDGQSYCYGTFASCCNPSETIYYAGFCFTL